jgi:hypothetical protein
MAVFHQIIMLVNIKLTALLIDYIVDIVCHMANIVL